MVIYKIGTQLVKYRALIEASLRKEMDKVEKINKIKTDINKSHKSCMSFLDITITEGELSFRAYEKCKQELRVCIINVMLDYLDQTIGKKYNRQYVTDSINIYLQSHHELNIEGFIKFRLKNLSNSTKENV